MFRSRDACGLHGASARLLPRELDRPQQRWRLSRLGAKHVGRLQSQQKDRQGAVAARRQTERLRDGAGDGVRVAARRAASGPRANQHLRRRRRAAGGNAVTGTRPATRRRPPAGAPRSQIRHRPGRIVSRFMGNAQVLGNGNVLVGWGSEPYVTEFGRDGEIRFDARLPSGGQNYRALRFPWAALPAVPPAIAYRAAGGKRRVHVSWNGATNVAAWELHAGPAARALAVVGKVRRTGFETAIAVPPGARYARVDRAGHRRETPARVQDDPRLASRPRTSPLRG